MSMLSALLEQFKDYNIGVQYEDATFANEIEEPAGWCCVLIFNNVAIVASGHETPIKAVVECVKLLKEKRGY